MLYFKSSKVVVIVLVLLLHAFLPASALLVAPRRSFGLRSRSRSAISSLSSPSRHHYDGVYSNRRLFSAQRNTQRQRRHVLHIAPQQLGEFEPINFTNVNDEEGRTITRNRRRVWLYDFVTQQSSTSTTRSRTTTVPYHEAWEFQKSLVEHQLTRIGKRPTKDPPLYDQFLPTTLDYDDSYNDNDSHNNNNNEAGNLEANNETNPPFLPGCDSIVMLQHDPVYTLGTASDPSFIRDHGSENHDGNDNDNIPIVRIERGGEVTYHGPGQLTVYPILDLRGYKQDIHWYMRALEEVILLALDKAGVNGATREDNLTGVWVSNKKIAALGIKARRWVTMHGLAINVDIRSLQNFEGIVPCGLEGRVVTCINEEMGGGDDDDESRYFTVEDFAVHVKEALEEIFDVSLVVAPTAP